MLRLLFVFQLILAVSRGNPSFQNHNEIDVSEPEPLILAPFEEIYADAYPSYHELDNQPMSPTPREEPMAMELHDPNDLTPIPHYMDDHDHEHGVFVREDDLGDANDDSQDEDLDDHGGHGHSHHQHKAHGHGWADPCETGQLGGINCGYNWFDKILVKHHKDLSSRRQDWDYTNRNYDVTRWYSNGWGWTSFPYGHPLDDYRSRRSNRGFDFRHPLDKYEDYSDPELSEHLTWKYWAMRKKFTEHWNKIHHYYGWQAPIGHFVEKLLKI